MLESLSSFLRGNERAPFCEVVSLNLKTCFCSSFSGCNLHLTSRNGAFTSPLYPHSYPNNTLCNYTITVQKGYRIHLHFLTFNMEYQESCLRDHLSIFEGSGVNDTLAEVLCGDKKNKQFISARNQLFLRMKSNEQITNAGFMVNYYTTQLCKLAN